jgi:hypothetical protein
MNRLRIGFAVAGYAAAVLSIVLDDKRLAWAAIALLAVSLIVRLLMRKRGKPPPDTQGPV